MNNQLHSGENFTNQFIGVALTEHTHLQNLQLCRSKDAFVPVLSDVSSHLAQRRRLLLITLNQWIQKTHTWVSANIADRLSENRRDSFGKDKRILKNTQKDLKKHRLKKIKNTDQKMKWSSFNYSLRGNFLIKNAFNLTSFPLTALN